MDIRLVDAEPGPARHKGSTIMDPARFHSNTSSATVPQEGFPNFVDAQLKELRARLATEHLRVLQRLEMKVQELEVANTKLRRQVQQLDVPEAGSQGLRVERTERRTNSSRSRKDGRSQTSRSEVSQLQDEWPVAPYDDSDIPEKPRVRLAKMPACWPSETAVVPQQPAMPNTLAKPTESPKVSPQSSGEKPGSSPASDRAGGGGGDRAGHVVVVTAPVPTQEASGEDSPATSSFASSGSSQQSASIQKVDDIATTILGSQSGRAARGSGQNATFQVLNVWVFATGDDANLSVSRGSRFSSGLIRKGSFMDFDECDDDVPKGAVERALERVILQPSSKFYFCWEIIGLLLVVRDIVVIPLQILDPMDSFFTSFVTWIARLFWTVDIAVSFLTGFVSSQGVVETRPSKVAKQYARTRLPMDSFIVICDWSEVAMGGDAGWNFLGMLRAMRLARLARLVKNQKRILEFMIRSEGLMLVATVQAYLLLLLVLIHVIACVWYGIQVSSIPDMAELEGGEREPLLGDLSHRYTFCFHFVLALFLGEHVVMPRNLLERAFTVVALFFAFVVSASFVGSLTTAMTRLQIIASQRSAQFAALSNYLSDYGISRELALRVQRNARHVLNEQKRNTPEHSVALLALVSDQLRAEIHYEVHMKDLVVHPYFKLYNEGNPICMRMICHSAISLQSLSRGDVLFSEFEVPATPQMYFITSGRLAYTQCVTGQQEVGHRHWISEALLWTTWVHRGTAQAMTECRTLALHAARFADIVTMYRSPKRYAFKYAHRFVQALNQMDEVDLTDIGDEDQAVSQANEVFSDENRESGHRASVRMTIRRSNLDPHSAFGSVIQTLTNKRRSSVHMLGSVTE